MKLISWFIVYSGNSLVLLSAYIIAILSTFFISPTNSGTRNIAILVAFMGIVYIINLNFKVTNVYEKNEGFFYFSAPLSRSSLPVMFAGTGLLFVMPFSLIVMDNSGINLSFGLFYLELLTLLFYYFITLSASLLLRKAQISTFLIIFLFISPSFLLNYLNTKSEILMVSALSPFSLSNPGFVLTAGLYSIMQYYVLFGMISLIVAIIVERWRSFT